MTTEQRRPATAVSAGTGEGTTEDDGYTVIGVWLSDEPVRAGVITGCHWVEGGDDAAFPEGLWATHVSAGDADEAETAAIQQMTDA